MKFLVIPFCLFFVSCVKEIPLSNENDQVYPFISGGIKIGSDTQELLIGLTRGTALSTGEIELESVVVSDLTSGAVVEFLKCGDIRYCGDMLGEYGHEYQIQIFSVEYGVFLSSPEKLSLVPLEYESTAGLEEARNEEGEVFFRDIVRDQISLFSSSSLSNVSILTKPFITWIYYDRVCGSSDISQECYIYESEGIPWNILEVSNLEVGDTIVFNSGSFDLDYRFNTGALVSTEILKINAKASRYFRQLYTAYNQNSGLFAETPLTVPGNLKSQVDSPGLPMLGYFLVSSHDTVHAVAQGQFYTDNSGGRVCTRGVVSGIDCCDCSRSINSSESRPPYWR